MTKALRASAKHYVEQKYMAEFMCKKDDLSSAGEKDGGGNNMKLGLARRPWLHVGSGGGERFKKGRREA